MANSIKMTYLMIGVVLTQGILFYLYYDRVWLSPWALVGMGGLPLCLLVDAKQRHRHWLKRACPVQGHLISYRNSPQTYHHWVILTVEYVVNGITHTCESYWPRDSPVPALGSPIDVLYNLDYPEQVGTPGSWPVMFWSIMVGYSVVGLLVIMIG